MVENERPDRRSSSWTLETLHAHLTALMNERDRRYQERFDAQEKAVEVALATVNKEFHEHLVQVREETQAALQAADKAIIKSEVAYEKRFEDLSKRLDDLRETLFDKLDSVAVSFDNKLAAIDAKVASTQAVIG